MSFLARWLAPVAIAAVLGAGATFSAPARANDDLVRVIVDIADVVYRSGHPYYRHGGHGHSDRLIIGRDRYNRPVYYRYLPRDAHRYDPPYGNAYGYHRNRDAYRHGPYQRTRCDSRGRCRVEYYDPRYDRRSHDRHGYGYGYGYGEHDRHHDRRRWHDDD